MNAVTQNYCTTDQAAQSLGCTPKHVVWLIHHKHLNAKRWMRAWMVDKTSVEKWNKSGKRRNRGGQ